MRIHFKKELLQYVIGIKKCAKAFCHNSLCINIYKFLLFYFRNNININERTK